LNSKSLQIASIPNVSCFDGIAIVCPSSRQICHEKEEGEVWIANGGVARGYWNLPLLTKEVFHNVLPDFTLDSASTPSSLAIVNGDKYRDSIWLTTGDLGYFENGHLFISGRLKDLIIINGKNVYPQDIENRVQDICADVIRPGCVIAFGVTLEETEGFVVVAEVRDSYLKSLNQPFMITFLQEQTIRQIESSLNSEFGGEIVQVVLIRERTIPKTTSGKVKRSEGKSKWIKNELEVIAASYLKIQNLSSFGVSLAEPQVLSWIKPSIKQILINREVITPSANENSFTSYITRAMDVCQLYKITEQNVELIHQGIDSMKVSELFHLLISNSDENSPLKAINDASYLFEWTGIDVLYAICNFLPLDKDLHRPIFPLSKNFNNANLPNLFLFHPLRGYATGYKLIEAALCDTFCVFGVNSHNFSAGDDETRFQFPPTFEAFVANYLPVIKRIQPVGPYRFGGYCLGGTIALELTRQLQMQGEEVVTLIILESHYHSLNKEVAIQEEFDLCNCETLRYDAIYEKNIERFLKNGFHIYRLLKNFTPKPFLHLIPKVIMIKGEGDLTTLIHQQRSGLYWDFGDLFCGSQFYFLPQQHLNYGTAFVGHMSFLTNFQKENICFVLKELLHQNDSCRFILNNNENNLRQAIRLNSLYLVRRILLVQNYEENYFLSHSVKLELLQLAYEHSAFDVLEFLVKLLNVTDINTNEDKELQDIILSIQQPLSNYGCIRNDAEKGEYKSLPRGNDENKMVDEGLQDLESSTPNIWFLNTIIQKLLFDRKFIFRSIFSITQQSFPSLLCYWLAALVYTLLLIRLLSSYSSLNTLAAFVIDNEIYRLFLSINQLLALPYINYLTIAFDRNHKNEVRKVFHAGLLLSLIIVIPLIIYGCVTYQIGQSMHINEDVTHEWSGLAAYHMIGILPGIWNICIDVVANSISYHGLPAFGLTLEAIVGLISALLFSMFSTLNGITLAISLSLGMWMRFLFYVYYIQLDDFLRPYKLFDFFPFSTQGTKIIVAWKVVKQFWNDMHYYCLIPVLGNFSNMLVIIFLLAASNAFETTLKLVGFAIGSSCTRIVSFPSVVIGNAAGLISFRICGSHNFESKNGFGFRMITLFLTMIIAGCFSLPLYLLSGEQISQFIISTTKYQILFDSSSFYSQVGDVIGYFLGIGLLNSVILPIEQFLVSSFSLQSSLKINLFIYFIIGNICLIVTFFKVSADSLAKDLLIEAFCIHGLAMIGLLYEWLKVTSFECFFEEIPQLQAQKSYSSAKMKLNND
jgi:hypothetical protein